MKVTPKISIASRRGSSQNDMTFVTIFNCLDLLFVSLGIHKLPRIKGDDFIDVEFLKGNIRVGFSVVFLEVPSG